MTNVGKGFLCYYMLIHAFDISFTQETLFSEKIFVFNFPVRLGPGVGVEEALHFGKGITTNIRRVFSNAQIISLPGAENIIQNYIWT